MFNRKTSKEKAKNRLKKHYFLYVFLCMLAAALGTEYTSSLNFVKLSNGESASEIIQSGGSVVEFRLTDAVNMMLKETDIGNTSKLEEHIKSVDKKDSEKKATMIGKHLQIGYSRGVLSSIYNEVTSGTFLISIFVAISTLIGSAKLSKWLFIIAAVALGLTFWVFVINVFKVVYARIFLEGRIYDKEPITRMIFLIQVRKWRKAVKTMLLKAIYFNLWSLTVVGGIIKYFSYFAVPYIVAENPDISPREAIKLSRNMMHGHKWECFKVKFSFILWNILGVLTLGILEVLFVNPYKEALYSEYYTYLRECAKEAELPGSELLKDVYLFEKANKELLVDTYLDIILLEESKKYAEEPKKRMVRVLRDVFGIIFYEDEKETEYRINEEETEKIQAAKYIINGEAYPKRLCVIPEKDKIKKLEQLYVRRHYSIWTLILMFMSLSFLGWMWEVSLHFIAMGTFVNRGVLHGPWLPIYGTGGVLILTILYRFRGNPWLEFIMTMLLCGTVEYTSGWMLEKMHHGERWWDYRGYFINIDGRVCAEGLLVFGLGGMVIIYVLAPMLDNLFRRMEWRTLVSVCFVLILVFCMDTAYSAKHPNIGNGITNDKAYLDEKGINHIENDWVLRGNG